MSAEQLLSSGEYGDAIVLADLEAGIGTLTRLDPSQIDLTLVVAEPTPRSLDVASRALTIARENDQGRIVVVVNKVEDAAVDSQLVKEKLGEIETVMVPYDPAVFDADRLGISVLDHDPNCPAAQALSALADLVA